MIEFNVTDRRLEEIHEHLPIGHGNIDFKRVFNEVLPGFGGKIIFEIIQSSKDIIAAKKYFEDLLNRSEIREIHLDDYDEIYTLWSRTSGMGLSDADSEQNIRNFLIRNKGMSFCYEENGKIIGTILCGYDGRRGYIYHVTVAEECRGRGIGRLLVEKSLQKLKESGIYKCHLFVFRDNEIGNAFWSSTDWIKREDIFVYSRDT